MAKIDAIYVRPIIPLLGKGGSGGISYDDRLERPPIYLFQRGTFKGSLKVNNSGEKKTEE
jgi:hypothetical protein